MKALFKNKGMIAAIAAIVVLIIILAVIIVTSSKKDKTEYQASEAAISEAAQQSETQPPTTKVDKTQWNLILVNSDNYVPENYEVNLTQLKNGQAVDERCYEDLQKMMDDCRAEGLEPVICSAYRTNEKQTELYNRQVDKWKAKGYSDSEARLEAGKLVAIPGTSEHQLGLAVDIVDVSYQLLDENQENTAVQKWLMQNSWKYGFILRYPTDKREITKITYEPWHYRYVGKDDAKKIFNSGLCLEEYLNQ